jgi:hypothetical protein
VTQCAVSAVPFDGCVCGWAFRSTALIEVIVMTRLAAWSRSKKTPLAQCGSVSRKSTNRRTRTNKDSEGSTGPPPEQAKNNKHHTAGHTHTYYTVCVSRIAQRLRLLLSVLCLRLCDFVCFISAPCWCYGFTDCELCLKVISHPCIHHCLTIQRNTADVGLSSLLSQVANPRFVDTRDLPSVTCPNQRRHHPQFSRTPC